MDYYRLSSLKDKSYETFRLKNEDFEKELFLFSDFLKQERDLTEEWNNFSIEVYKSAGTKKVDFPNFIELLVSEKVKDIIEKNTSCKDVSFLKIPYEKENYFFIHCFNLLKQEDVILKEDSIIKENRLGKIDLFFSNLRFREDFEEDLFSFCENKKIIIVSEKLKNILEKAKVKGVYFRKIGTS